MSLKERHAIITGISKGIGKAIAQALLNAGGSVSGWGLTKPEWSHAGMDFFRCDVSNEDEVNTAFSKTISIHPKIDFLINNAGFGYFSPIESFDTGKWKMMLDVNLTGTFLCTRAVAAHMIANHSGHIINISSIAGRTAAAQGEGYNASKFGVSGFSEALFMELRPKGIKVTTVYPGSTETNFFDEIPSIDAHSNMIQPADLAASIIHILDSAPNYLIREIEIRPMNPKPPEKK